MPVCLFGSLQYKQRRLLTHRHCTYWGFPPIITTVGPMLFGASSVAENQLTQLTIGPIFCSVVG